MQTDYIPAPDEAFAAWLRQFVQTAEANLPALGLSAADLQTLAAQTPQFADAVQTVFSQKNKAAAAISVKDNLRGAADGTARALVNKIQANPSVPEALKRTLGITVRRTRPRLTPPAAPTELHAAGADSGAFSLKWDRNGNAPGTLFEVEARVGMGAQWCLVGVVTACKMTHTGQIPGVPICYRVRARRGKTTSVPCPSQPTLYANGTAGYNVQQEDALYGTNENGRVARRG